MNAFVDLGHKIIIQNTIFKIYSGNTQVTLTAIINALILLPFVLLFTPAGFISDKWSKPRVLRNAAWIALGLTLLITLFYYLGWFWAAFLMTLLLGAQATFYSPAKYGYIKELVGAAELTTANGIIQAVSTARDITRSAPELNSNAVLKSIRWVLHLTPSAVVPDFLHSPTLFLSKFG